LNGGDITRRSVTEKQKKRTKTEGKRKGEKQLHSTEKHNPVRRKKKSNQQKHKEKKKGVTRTIGSQTKKRKKVLWWGGSPFVSRSGSKRTKKSKGKDEKSCYDHGKGQLSEAKTYSKRQKTKKPTGEIKPTQV